MPQPDFRILPPVPGVNGLRWVGTTMMDEEQYRVEGWHIGARPGVEAEYTVDHPRHGPMRIAYWRATLDGLQRYTALRRTRREERKDAWRAREAEEDSFREFVDALDDAKPQP